MLEFKRSTWLMLAICLGLVSGCTEDGPKISVDVNVRNLCNVPVSGENENRCVVPDDCSDGTFCWRPAPKECLGIQDCSGGQVCEENICIQQCQVDADCPRGTLCLDPACMSGGYCRRCETDAACDDLGQKCDDGLEHQACSNDNECTAPDLCRSGFCRRDGTGWCHRECSGDAECISPETCSFGFCRNHRVCMTRGYCRVCESDANCDIGSRCDHGWCHLPCTSTANCSGTEKCTGDLCRKFQEEGTEINFCNTGNRDLVVYTERTGFYGYQSSCAFSRWEWSPNQPEVVLAPDDCDLWLKVRFTPPEVGEYRAYLAVTSNAIDHNPLPILMCGQAVEAKCTEGSMDGSCPDCLCAPEDFSEIMETLPLPDCSAYD